MKTLKLTVYVTSDGEFVDEPVNETRPNLSASMRNYFREKNPEIAEWSAKNLRNRAFRAKKTRDYANWLFRNSHMVTSEVLGTACIEYDGRLKEREVKRAIIRALNEGKNYVKIPLSSNAQKPAIEHVVYTQIFAFHAI
jgi:hypothetical protein